MPCRGSPIYILLCFNHFYLDFLNGIKEYCLVQSIEQAAKLLLDRVFMSRRVRTGLIVESEVGQNHHHLAPLSPPTRQKANLVSGFEIFDTFVYSKTLFKMKILVPA